MRRPEALPGERRGLPVSVVDDLRKLDGFAYDRALERVVSAARHMAGVLWVGQFGSAKIPGISDLDLLIICENEVWATVAAGTREIARSDSESAYIFAHAPYVVPVGALERLRFTHTLENLRTLSGDAALCEVIREPSEEMRFFREMLWNSNVWGRVLAACGREQMSLRGILMLTRNVRRSARNNYELAGSSEASRSGFSDDGAERLSILGAPSTRRGGLALAALQHALEALIESDRVVASSASGVAVGPIRAGRKEVQLPGGRIFRFERNPESAHQYRRGKIVRELNVHYSIVSDCLTLPYCTIERELELVWGRRNDPSTRQRSWNSTAGRWATAVLEQFSILRAAGASHMSCNVYPFNVFPDHARSTTMAARVRNRLSLLRGAGP